MLMKAGELTVQVNFQGKRNRYYVIPYTPSKQRREAIRRINNWNLPLKEQFKLFSLPSLITSIPFMSHFSTIVDTKTRHDGVYGETIPAHKSVSTF